MSYSPVRHSLYFYNAFDLHVLGTPPAFILSQDQTLHCFLISSSFDSFFYLFSLAFACFSSLYWRFVLFSFQCPLFSPFLDCLFILSPFFYFCNYFFIFFLLFSSLPFFYPFLFLFFFSLFTSLLFLFFTYFYFFLSISFMVDLFSCKFFHSKNEPLLFECPNNRALSKRIASFLIVLTHY